MRTLDYLGSGFKDIRRQPIRTLLTVTALIISTSLFVVLVALGLETRTAIVSQIQSDSSVNSIIVSSSKTISSGFFSTSVQVANQATSTLDDTTAQKFSAIGGVESATPIVNVWEFKQFNVNGLDGSFVAKTTAIKGNTGAFYTLAAGSPLIDTDTAPQVVVGYSYAKALGLADRPEALVGKTITITTQNAYRGAGASIPAPTASRATQESFANSPSTLSARIVGVTNAGTNDNALYIPFGWARAVESPQTWSGGKIVTEDSIEKNGYSAIVVNARSSHAVAPISSAIEKMGYGVSSRQKQIDQINQLSLVMWIVLGSVALVSLISASLGIINTMLMAISEQRYVISVWRACGATRSLIARLFIAQAAILGSIGGVIGTLLGAWISGLINQKIALVLQAQGLASLSIESASTTLLLAALALAILLSTLAGLYPAYRAARKIYV